MCSFIRPLSTWTKIMESSKLNLTSISVDADKNSSTWISIKMKSIAWHWIHLIIEATIIFFYSFWNRIFDINLIYLLYSTTYTSKNISLIFLLCAFHFLYRVSLSINFLFVLHLKKKNWPIFVMQCVFNQIKFER